MPSGGQSVAAAAREAMIRRSFSSGTEMSVEPTIDKKAPPAPEIIEVDATRVMCDGGGPLGHPRVYLEMGDEDFVECPYCDRRFVLKAGAERH
jgi:uncharacterized Zn-finger protein